MEERPNGIEYGNAIIMISFGCSGVYPGEFNFLDMFLKEPVVDKCIFPFRNQLGF